MKVLFKRYFTFILPRRPIEIKIKIYFTRETRTYRVKFQRTDNNLLKSFIESWINQHILLHGLYQLRGFPFKERRAVTLKRKKAVKSIFEPYFVLTATVNTVNCPHTWNKISVFHHLRLTCAEHWDKWQARLRRDTSRCPSVCPSRLCRVRPRHQRGELRGLLLARVLLQLQEVLPLAGQQALRHQRRAHLLPRLRQEAVKRAAL